VALGAARVVAVEENALACASIRVLATALALDGVVEARCASLYDDGALAGAFDVVVVSGVLYHVSDPVLALRKLHGALAPGGVLYAETAVTANRAAPDAPPLVEYWGARRPGYNRDVPEPRAFEAWLEDAGFEDVRVTDGGRPRSLAAARKPKAYADFLRAGFAIPDLC
jgi:SAM-dependent methyltransferase